MNRANGVGGRYGATLFALSGERKRAKGVACRYGARGFAVVGEGKRAKGVASRCPGDVAGRCPGEAVRAWLGTVAMWRRGGPLPWRVSPRLVGDCRYVASQCVLDWRLSLLSVAGRCVASQFALGWRDCRNVAGRCPGESVRAWLGTVAMWRVNARLIGHCRY
ncbi:hypothetical protein ACLB2K_046376 [Fragaria x ananassa]